MYMLYGVLGGRCNGGVVMKWVGETGPYLGTYLSLDRFVSVWFQ